MRLSRNEAIKHILASTQDQVCPSCGQLGPFNQMDMTETSGKLQSYDLITCHKCNYQWQSAFSIVLYPIVN